MRLKLDLLFNYSDENKILTEFKKQKTELSNLTQSLVGYRKDYIAIVENEDNASMINTAIIRLNEITQKLKVLKMKYDGNTNETYLKDMVEIYIRDIKPLVETVKTAKYKHNFIDDNENDNTRELIQCEYINSDLYIPLDSQNNAKIITNKK
jgi:predicted DNA-binding protein